MKSNVSVTKMSQHKIAMTEIAQQKKEQDKVV